MVLGTARRQCQHTTQNARGTEHCEASVDSCGSEEGMAGMYAGYAEESSDEAESKTDSDEARNVTTNNIYDGYADTHSEGTASNNSGSCESNDDGCKYQGSELQYHSQLLRYADLQGVGGVRQCV